jgi:hypothetical protein
VLIGRNDKIKPKEQDPLPPQKKTPNTITKTKQTKKKNKTKQEKKPNGTRNQ